MFKHLNFITLALPFSLKTLAQQQMVEHDRVENDSIKIVNPSGKTYLLGSRDQLKQVWGRPKIKKEPEKCKVAMDKYYVEKNSLSIFPTIGINFQLSTIVYSCTN